MGDDCPEPFWHDTHRYCPSCSWTEQDECAFCLRPWAEHTQPERVSCLSGGLEKP